MKCNKIYYCLLVIMFWAFFAACGQVSSNTQPKNVAADTPVMAREALSVADTAALIQAFEVLKKNPSFLKDLGLEGEKHFSWNVLPKGIIYGDLDKDGSEDALFPFTIEGRGGGNSWDFHYVVFLQKNKQWQYLSQFDAQAGDPDLLFAFREIKDCLIQGAIVDNQEERQDIPVTFILKGNELVNTYTALHRTDVGEREFLEVNEILNANNVSIPLTATLKDYQKILGSGKITEPEQQPDCGTYFDEGMYRELHYPNLVFELSNNKKAAFQSLIFKNSGLKIQTNKGTITEKTTLTELEAVLQKRDNWWISDGEDRSGKSISIPTNENADDGWVIQFDKNGNIEKVILYIPC